MVASVDLFDNHKYLNVETFRKSGVGVQTPVWFVREGETLYVWTQANSGKAKRIRNNPHVRIAPCKADGALLGDWVPALAHVDGSPETVRHVAALMRRKYGLLFLGFRLLSILRKNPITTLRIQLEPAT
jgi:hypothetical protein